MSFQPICDLIGHSHPVAVVRFSPNGQALASAGADHTVRLWSLISSALSSSSSSALSASSSSSSSSSQSTSSLLSPPPVTSLRTSRSLDGHTQGVSDLSWSPDGSLLASASDDGTLRIWDVGEGRSACKPLRGHVNHVMCLHFCPRANIIASGSFDESVKLWDLRSGRCIRTIQAHSEPITTVQFHSDGSTLATSSFDGLVRLWDHGSGQCLKTLQTEGTPPVGSFRFSPNGRFLLCGTLDARIRLWDYVSARRLKTYTGHTNSNLCMGLAFVSRKRRRNSTPQSLIPVMKGTSAMDADIEAGSNAKEGNTGSLPTDASPGNDDQPYVASGSEDGTIVLWDTQTRTIVQTLSGHSGAVVALDSHPNKAIIASASSGGEESIIKIWEEI